MSLFCFVTAYFLQHRRVVAAVAAIVSVVLPIMHAHLNANKFYTKHTRAGRLAAAGADIKSAWQNV